jgi:hypothetical protein
MKLFQPYTPHTRVLPYFAGTCGAPLLLPPDSARTCGLLLLLLLPLPLPLPPDSAGTCGLPLDSYLRPDATPTPTRSAGGR